MNQNKKNLKKSTDIIIINENQMRDQSCIYYYYQKKNTYNASNRLPFISNQTKKKTFMYKNEKHIYCKFNTFFSVLLIPLQINVFNL